MTLNAQYAALQRASDLIADIRQGLVDEHAKVDVQVNDLLDGRWTGEAAAQLKEAWAQWCTGMREVLSGLSLESAAIAATKAELSGTDAEVRTSLATLRARLGDVPS